MDDDGRKSAPVTPDEIAALFAAVVPEKLERTVERANGWVDITMRAQPGLVIDVSFGWDGGDDQLFWLVCDLFRYEELGDDALDQAAARRFAAFVGDLLSGTIQVEVTRFRSNGALWRSRLVDPRRPEGDQIIYRYYRQVSRWWRPVTSELVRLNGGG